MSAAKSLTDDLVPMLENGDRLTSAEFERRYEAMPELKKAELIEGVVFLSSPVSKGHSRAHSILGGWLLAYSAAHPEASSHNDGSVRLDIDNQFQPDVMLRRVGKETTASDKEILDGAPELVAEIALSSVSRDLYAKKHVYRRTGVREYIVWRVLDREVDWFELRDGDFVARQPDSAGIIESRVFPGLRLNVTALLAGDVAAVLKALR
jgi:Uma2 family endonuclease